MRYLLNKIAQLLCLTLALARAREERDAALAQAATLRRCLGFFASVIKSGEPWTETCEREYRAALAALEDK